MKHKKFIPLLFVVCTFATAQEVYDIPVGSSLEYSHSAYGGMWDYFSGDHLISSKYTIQASFNSSDQSGLIVILTPDSEEISKLPIPVKIKPIPAKKISINNSGEIAKKLATQSELDKVMVLQEDPYVIVGEGQFLITSFSTGIECDYREYNATIIAVIQTLDVAKGVGKKVNIC
ncbi:hypothetical protein [Simiduia agarivorans]|uniref:Uncharacterized protein n=1 Tax=Simiduia agarivorans (strain DSM 21679 / JCM 13881 / BCRC 17597 / SA1) TaxID=1117647 RepID=K4KKU5_SIMAS|nr:hypothetical protein [Simiduia agarivorans]AFU99769.1 hypothetical protein M5M_13125 [Simiduia agarivorans SA1 = DSM 21679]